MNGNKEDLLTFVNEKSSYDLMDMKDPNFFKNRINNLNPLTNKENDNLIQINSEVCDLKQKFENSDVYKPTLISKVVKKS